MSQWTFILMQQHGYNGSVSCSNIWQRKVRFFCCCYHRAKTVPNISVYNHWFTEFEIYYMNVTDFLEVVYSGGILLWTRSLLYFRCNISFTSVLTRCHSFAIVWLRCSVFVWKRPTQSVQSLKPKGCDPWRPHAIPTAFLLL